MSPARQAKGSPSKRKAARLTPTSPTFQTEAKGHDSSCNGQEEARFRSLIGEVGEAETDIRIKDAPTKSRTNRMR